jgi:hypothetical protein
MKFKTRNGLQVEGQTATDIIGAMKQSGRFTEHQTITEYMASLSQREKEYSGHDLVTTSADAFIDSAIASGLLLKD